MSSGLSVAEPKYNLPFSLALVCRPPVAVEVGADAVLEGLVGGLEAGGAAVYCGGRSGSIVLGEDRCVA